jgi:hypothetical protein
MAPKGSDIFAKPNGVYTVLTFQDARILTMVHLIHDRYGCRGRVLCLILCHFCINNLNSKTSTCLKFLLLKTMNFNRKRCDTILNES